MTKKEKQEKQMYISTIRLFCKASSRIRKIGEGKKKIQKTVRGKGKPNVRKRKEYNIKKEAIFMD